MLAPAGTDKPPQRTVRALIRGSWLRYTVRLVALAAFIATMFVFRTGSAAWWDSDTVFLLLNEHLVRDKAETYPYFDQSLRGEEPAYR